MTRVVAKTVVRDPGSALPSELAPLLRATVPTIAAEIVQEIRSCIPEYASVLTGPRGTHIMTGVKVVLGQFVDQVADSQAPRQQCAEICRQLGRFESASGRSLDTLRVAYRLGARVAWRRLAELGRRSRLPLPTMCLLGEALFAYMDELAALSAEGYAAARAHADPPVRRRRKRLLKLILAEPSTPMAAITELARSSRWEPPSRVRAIALQRRVGQPARGATSPLPVKLPETVLFDLEGPQPCLLIPDADCDNEQLRRALRGWRAAAGPEVPLAHAAWSLRWARQALVLVARGVLADAELLDCTAQLSTLWLSGDEFFATELVRRVLAPLAGLTRKQRTRLADTLLLWLECPGGAPEVAGRLGIHPQTVRYRVHQLAALFGDRLRDPDARFDLQVALRALRLRSAGPAKPGQRALMRLACGGTDIDMSIVDRLEAYDNGTPLDEPRDR